MLYEIDFYKFEYISMKTRTTMMFVIHLALLYMAEGFLLETNTQNSNFTMSGSKVYLTVAEYYHDKKEQRHAQELMSDETDKTVNLLATQTQQRFEALEKRLLNCEQRHNTMTWENLYRELENNYTNLQEQFITLEEKYLQLNKTITLESSELETVKNYSSDNKKRLEFQNYELVVVKHKTKELAKRIDTFGKMEAIRQLQDLLSLKQRVRNLTTRTDLITIREQARNQDLISLHNQMVAYSNTLRDSTMRVAFTALVASDHTYYSGQVIKFTNVISVVGFQNLSSFTANGKLTIEKNGLYQLSVSILSNTLGGIFYIYKNDNAFPYTYISNDIRYDLATTVMVLELVVNDTVCVQPGSSLDVDSEGSKFTIVKIK